MIPKQLASRIDSLRPYDVFDRPIFILSAPRSGSTFLFEILRRFEDVWAWHAELDATWWKLFPYERTEDPSDYVGAEDYTPRLAGLLRRDLYRFALWARQERGLRCSLKERLGAKRIRYLDKTIANCFHVGFLEHAFPDALYIVLLRDGRATISSMMEGWQDPERFAKDRLQPYLSGAGTRLSHWSYPAPPGWHLQVDRPLEEVCAWSWRQHLQAVVEFAEDLPASRKLVVKYEELAESPAEVARRVGRFCQLEWRDAVAEFAERRPLSRTTVSSPDAGKWRRLHGEEIERILPMIGDLLEAFEY